jgi:hypothetical protein
LALTGFPLLALTMFGLALILTGFIIMRASMIRRAEAASGGSASLWHSSSSGFWVT